MSKASDLETLAKSYLDLWQDQFATVAADPANAEAMARLDRVAVVGEVVSRRGDGALVEVVALPARAEEAPRGTELPRR